MFKNKEKNEEYEDLTDKNFIQIQDEEPFINIKFYSITPDLETKEILKGIKSGNEILFIDLTQLLEDQGNLRIFVNKIRRVSDDFSITMKLYGKNWLLILPQNVTFHVGEE